jgi:hypothetical protein
MPGSGRRAAISGLAVACLLAAAYFLSAWQFANRISDSTICSRRR